MGAKVAIKVEPVLLHHTANGHLNQLRGLVHTLSIFLDIQLVALAILIMGCGGIPAGVDDPPPLLDVVPTADLMVPFVE